MVNDNLLSSPTAKKTVRFQATIDHVTEAVSSNTNLSNNRLPSTTTDSSQTVIESSSVGIDNDKDEYLSQVLDIPDTPVSFDTINVQSHALPIHSSFTHATVVPVDSGGPMNSDDLYSDNNATSDDMVSPSVDGEYVVDEEDVVVSSGALETTSSTLETVLKEFEKDIEEHSLSDDETGESISSSPSADVTITCHDDIESTRDKLLGTRESGKVRTVYPSTIQRIS
jgi:hypothetical protein